MKSAEGRALDSWTCACGHAHRYEPPGSDRVGTLKVTCVGCRQSGLLRAWTG
jgi:hypothetical protein